MPHPRPTGDQDALSTLLRSATQEVHKAAEQRPFMQAFFGGELPRAAYVEWLARQLHLYRAIERRLEAFAGRCAEGDVFPTALHRAARIEDDLDLLSDAAWRSTDHLTPATTAYVARIESTDGFPPGVVVHAWLRYMGNVGGRDVLRRLASASTGLPEDAPRGLAFADFSAVGEVRPFFAEVHGRLDGLVLSPSERDRAVEEAEAGFRCNIALTDELAADFGIG
jgi:heme oxygenase